LLLSYASKLVPHLILGCVLQAITKPHKETAAERLTTPTAMRMLKTLQQTQVCLPTWGTQAPQQTDMKLESTDVHQPQVP
jgi:hypothetical protein